jgi:hypothetical protein
VGGGEDSSELEGDNSCLMTVGLGFEGVAEGCAGALAALAIAVPNFAEVLDAIEVLRW